MVIPLIRASCSRVTHPCAGRHQRLLLTLMLPLDLHVLSLPLAFILSQDQTLHCIKVYIILSLSLTLIILSKELTLLDKLYFLGTCFLYSNQSFQWTSQFLLRDPFFERGCKGTHYFQTSKLFWNFFSKFLFSHHSCASLSKNSQPHQPPVFQMGVQRYDFLINFQIFREKFHDFFSTFLSAEC